MAEPMAKPEALELVNPDSAPPRKRVGKACDRCRNKKSKVRTSRDGTGSNNSQPTHAPYGRRCYTLLYVARADGQ